MFLSCVQSVALLLCVLSLSEDHLQASLNGAAVPEALHAWWMYTVLDSPSILSGTLLLALLEH